MFPLTACCVGGLGRGRGEEHIQRLLPGLEEPKVSCSSCFKIRLDFSTGDESNSMILGKIELH